MELIHNNEGDHDFFHELGAPERSTGWVDGWRVEISMYGEMELIEFFDAEKNELFECSPVRGSDLDLALDEIVYERYGVER